MIVSSVLPLWIIITFGGKTDHLEGKLGGASRSGGEELDDQSRIVESVTVVMEGPELNDEPTIGCVCPEIMMICPRSFWPPLISGAWCATWRIPSAPLRQRIDLFKQIFIKRNVEEGGPEGTLWHSVKWVATQNSPDLMISFSVLVTRTEAKHSTGPYEGDYAYLAG